MWEPMRAGLCQYLGQYLHRYMMALAAFILGMILTLDPAGAQERGGIVNDPVAAPIIDRDRADRIEPQIGRPPPAAARPAPSVGIAPDARPVGDTPLAGLRYVGASLPRAQLDAAVASYIGRPLDRETLQGVANAVGGVYAKSDIAFYAVSIPAQVPSGGMLTVQITEGKLRDFTLADTSPSMPNRLIKAHMNRLMRSTPLSKSALQRALSLLRDIPGQTVEARVRQLGQPGDLALDLSIKRKQIQFGVLIDNSGVNNVVNGVQAQLSVTINGLAREGDSTRLSGYLPFYPDRYQYYSLSHSTPIGSNGMTLTASAAQVDSTSRHTRIKGEATFAGLTLSYPVVRSYRTNLSVSASLDGIDSSNYFLDTRFGDYRARAVRLGASWSRVEEKDGYALSAVVSRGLDAFNAKPFLGFSEATFTKVNAQAVAANSLTPKLALRTTVKAQYSRDNLPVTERFALGGRGAGMAFNIGVLTAERAVAGSMELSWSLPAKSALLKKSAVFLYADGAVAHTTARPAFALPAQDYSLASAGVGMRIGLGPRWRASIEAALPVKRPFTSDSRKARVFFGLGRTI